jgi:KDO2-lipid IV(A) lauroyltransferase
MHLLVRFLALFPLRALHALGDGIGRLLWLIPNNRRRTALRNIAACFPEMTPAEQAALCRESLRHEMKSVAETPFFWLGPKDKLLASIHQSTGEELLEQALARGKGVILLTMHLGGWEAAGHAYATRHPITGLYKPQGGALEALGLKGRSRTGAKLIATQGGSVRQQAIPLLANNEALYFMPDQDPPEGRGIFAPFFGVMAHSPVLVAKLVQETGAAVIFMYSERLPKGRGFVAHYHAAPEGIDSPDLLTAVTAMNLGVERCVRECPQQYWWAYRRFRRRPPGEPAFY